jgi:cobalt-zinc-cadmium resistance protein CzcA
MKSAILDNIILIVFIPYSLSGIEGRMFKPMAMTFSFAWSNDILFYLYLLVSSLF